MVSNMRIIISAVVALIVLEPVVAWGWIWRSDDYACSASWFPRDADAPGVEWESIEETGEELEDGSGPWVVDVGFIYTAYGQPYSTATVTLEGVVIFGEYDAIAQGPRGIPDAFIPNGYVSPIWISPESTSYQSIYIEQLGTAPRRRFVVEWRNVWVRGEISQVSFQLEIEEGTGAFWFHYLNDGDFDSVASIGIERQDGIEGIELWHGPTSEIDLTGETIVCAPTFDGDGDLYTIFDGDCDDDDLGRNPGEMEWCNGVDDNCDGEVDEGFDLDGDGFTSCGGDCSDHEADINPNGEEICNDLDDDCDDLVDEGLECDVEVDEDAGVDGFDADSDDFDAGPDGDFDAGPDGDADGDADVEIEDVDSDVGHFDVSDVDEPDTSTQKIDDEYVRLPQGCSSAHVSPLRIDWLWGILILWP